MLTVTPASVIEDKINMVLNKTLFTGYFVDCDFYCFIRHHHAIHTRNQKGTDGYCLCWDEVTGGYSFAKFLKKQNCCYPLRADKKTAIVSMDIDGFKYFNDMFGYGEGNDLCVIFGRK